MEIKRYLWKFSYFVYHVMKMWLVNWLFDFKLDRRIVMTLSVILKKKDRVFILRGHIISRTVVLNFIIVHVVHLTLPWILYITLSHPWSSLDFKNKNSSNEVYERIIPLLLSAYCLQDGVLCLWIINRNSDHKYKI